MRPSPRAPRYSQRPLGSSQRRVINSGLVSAWNAWTGHADAERENRALMTRCIQRALDAQLHGAWDKWAEVTAQLQQMRGVLARAVHAGLSKGFNSWLGHLDDLQAMRRCLQIAMNSSLSRAWASWCDHADAQHEQREKMQTTMAL